MMLGRRLNGCARSADMLGGPLKESSHTPTGWI